MKQFLAILALLTLISPTAASATDHGIELTLFGGYRSEGDLDLDDPFDEFLDSGLQIEDGDVLGAILGIPLTDHVILEFLYSQQDTTLVDDGGLFEPDLELSELDVTYIQAGLQYQWSPGQLHPFVGAGLGVAILDPDASFLDQETRLSASISGGLKIFVTDHFGVRIEGRALWADIDDEEFDDDCCRHRNREDDDLFQAEVTAGIIFKF